MRLCLQCEHCDVDLGSYGYSKLTPGGPGSIECYRGHFDFEAEQGFGTEKAWLAFQQAETCADFSPAAWAKRTK
jgi:hypothetical protein